MDKILEKVIIKGTKGQWTYDALIDTGATVSLIPKALADQVGVTKTLVTRSVQGVHRDIKTFPVVIANLHFVTLNRGSDFPFVMSNSTDELIVGMDIMMPLGISIDTKTGKLTVINEVWEGFKNLATAGVIVTGIAWFLGEIFKEK